VTVGAAPLSVAGATIGTTTLNTNGGNGEWISFDVVTTATGGLAQNTGAGWQFTIDGLTMTAPAVFDNAYAQWSVNGSPAPTQNSFGGLVNQGNVNPITRLGPGYGGNPFTPGPAQTVYNFDPVIFVTPCSFVTAGGIPITANDFHELLHFTFAAPPPPGARAIDSSHSRHRGSRANWVRPYPQAHWPRSIAVVFRGDTPASVARRHQQRGRPHGQRRQPHQHPDRQRRAGGACGRTRPARVGAERRRGAAAQ
jgi:hypothetical protein